MTVYVDDMYKYAMGEFRRMKMSHMIADFDEELHAMAALIGVKRGWFQGDHYDVSMSCRAKAVAAGAVPIQLQALGIMMAFKRRTGILPRLDEVAAIREENAARVRAEYAWLR